MPRFSSLALYGLLAFVVVIASGRAQHPEGSDWWAYRPLERPAVPVADRDSWARNDIDHFVLARLRQHGLEPAAPASRAVLIRRLTFDLTGLPPSPEEVQAFVADREAGAYERLVERLLAQPQYGVKWGRHWLDLVRYAETNSFERDSKKPAVWRYRDWVIGAFNQDLPWAQFLTLQLAGDELPEPDLSAMTATGFHRLGLWDDEPTDPLQARFDDLDSVADTTARSMLGISIGCARCHDHKKDPITARDYYSFVSFFEHVKPYRPTALGNRMAPQNFTARVPVDGAVREYEAELARYLDGLTRLRKGARQALVEAYRDLGASRRVASLAAARDALEAAYRAEATAPDRLVDHIGERHGMIRGQIVPVEGRKGTALRFDGDDSAELPVVVKDSFTIAFFVRSAQPGRGRDDDPRWFLGSGLVDGEVPGIVDDYGIAWLGDGRVAAGTGNPETFVSSPTGNADGLWHHVAFTRDRPTGRIALYVDGRLCGEAVGGTQSLGSSPRLVVGQMQPGGGGFAGELDEIEFYQRALTTTEVVALALDVPGGIAAGTALHAGTEVVAEYSRLQQPELETVTVLCALENDGEPEPSYVRLRGNANVRGAQVRPAFPAIFSVPEPVIERPAHGRTSGRRTALARWITDPSNPLTWRVLANRLWQHHFGRGLSRTPNDFGRLGVQPTHPELLDWLASEVLARGGSVKAMHRLIVQSATYRQACVVDLPSFDRDPTNDRFWRFDRRRLTAEEVRDSMLAVSGVLNLAMGGPSVYPPLPKAVLATASRPDAAWGRSSPEQAARRSVYVHVKRSLLEPLLLSFDMADTDASCPVRFATVQPTQALTLLNSDFAQRRATEFAARLQSERQGLAAQLERAIWLVTSRPPDAATRDDLLALCDALQKQFGRSEQQALQQCCLLLLNCNEFLYLD